MDVCAKLRGILGERRVGHGGTLDPMATGVLPVFVGSATKAVEFAEKGDKEYVAGLRLGLVTNTQDTTGEALEEREALVTGEQLEAALGDGGRELYLNFEEANNAVDSLCRDAAFLCGFRLCSRLVVQLLTA